MQYLHDDCEKGIAVLTLARPEMRNALSAELTCALGSRVAALLADDAVRGLVVTGAGKAFCTGLDLRDVRAHLRPGRYVWKLRPLTECVATEREGSHIRGDAMGPLDLLLQDLAAIYAAMQTADKPIVAAVNGPAVAGGAGLVCCCDAAVAGTSAVIGFPGIRVGLVAPVLTGPLVRRVGPGWARYLLLSGELLDAPRALACGLVQEVVPDGECVARAIALAQRLGEMPRAAFVATKRLAALPIGNCENEALLLYDDSTAAALDRFLQRRGSAHSP